LELGFVHGSLEKKRGKREKCCIKRHTGQWVRKAEGDWDMATTLAGQKSLGFAVDYRYPGLRANTRQMQAALRNAERVRQELRASLGLPP
jgi:hypothetical protein